MKNCRRCFELKSITDFYKHKKMQDGHLNVCKDCCKTMVSKRIEAMKQNQEWIIRERERCRIKSRKRTVQIDLDKKKDYMRTYFERYPEKNRAKTLAQHIKCESGYQKHHWSYQERDGKSLFFLKVKDHALVHRFLVYDKSAMKYRTLTGELLDTKEKHGAHIDYILRNHPF